MSDFEFQTPAETKTKRGSSTSARPKQPTPKTEPVEIKSEATVEEQVLETPAKPKYDPDELARIFDDVIFSGEYIEEITIKGKLRIRLRTRTAEEIEQISIVIDGTSANLISTLAEKRAILNLQYALVAYSGKDLRSWTAEDRAKFVKRLPGPVIGALLVALNDFDAKVYAACQEAEENF
jgi:hypothetical protein